MSDKRSQAKKKTKSSAGSVAAQIIVSIILIAAIVVIFVYAKSNTVTINQDIALDFEENTIEEAEEEEEEEEKIVYENIAVDNDEIHAGDLILVNADYAYEEYNAEEIASIYTYKTDNDISSFSVSGADTALRTPAIVALADMLDDFYVATGHDDIIIQSGYRSTEEQQRLYDEDLEMTGEDSSDLVALPGHSEHESGYAIDVSIYTDEGTIEDYDGTGDYTWIDKNCAHYGYILRYTEEKSDITAIRSEEWHYRYVGQPHATYMMENNLCLEEYIDLLRAYNEENHLSITNWDGEIYEVYFVEADTSADMTYVLIPEDGDYTISGNNVDGFIVTIDTGEIQTYDLGTDDDEEAQEDTESTEDIEESEDDAEESDVDEDEAE